MTILFSLLMLWASANDNTCGSVWDISEARQRKEINMVRERANKSRISFKLAKQQIDLESVRDFLFAGLPKDIDFIRFSPTHIAGTAKYSMSDLALTILRNADLTPVFRDQPASRHPEVPGSNYVTTLFLQAFSARTGERSLVHKIMPIANQGIGISFNYALEIAVRSPHRLEKIIEIHELYEPINYHYKIAFVKKESGQLQEVRITSETAGDVPRDIRFIDDKS